MKKTLIVLLMVLLCAMLFISCNDDAGSSSPKETYMVTFRLGESSSTGSAFDAQEVVEGEKAKKPDTNPTATDTHKTFKYWSANGTSEFKFDETPITKDIVLQAVYRDYEVGDTGPAGGIIFYVATSEQSSTYNGESITWKYLEAAPADTGSTYIWGSVGTSDGNKGTETAVGKGWSNIKKMAAIDIDNFNAADTAMDYRGGGKSDWFLPSKDELNEMYQKRNIIGGFDTTATYWSSSEDGSDTTKAWAQKFSDGSQVSCDRDNGCWFKIRPIRAF